MNQAHWDEHPICKHISLIPEVDRKKRNQNQKSSWIGESREQWNSEQEREKRNKAETLIIASRNAFSISIIWKHWIRKKTSCRATGEDRNGIDWIVCEHGIYQAAMSKMTHLIHPSTKRPFISIVITIAEIHCTGISVRRSGEKIQPLYVTTRRSSAFETTSIAFRRENLNMTALLG